MFIAANVTCSIVCLYLFVCVLSTTVSCAKIDKLVKILFR